MPGSNRLCEADRKGGPVVEGARWAHARRKFSTWPGSTRRRQQARQLRASMACLPSSAKSTAWRRGSGVGARTERSRPLVIELESRLRERRARVSKKSDTGQAIDDSPKRWLALI